ncbi:MAG TPA: four helix bundle protein [Anaerolineales bacterium]|nr:four helix bundle protein [Anaerolineales bacterium]
MVDFEPWQATVPARIRAESLWKFIGYRKSLYLYEQVWDDTNTWKNDPRAWPLARQIIASTGSISANLEEGRGRGSNKEMLYHYRIALASARETKGWFFRARNLVPEAELESRMSIIDEIIALLVTEIAIQRDRIQEDQPTYAVAEGYSNL